MSGEGPAMSDARAMADGAVEQPVPPAAQGQVFSPARQPGGEADDASTRWPQQQGAAPAQPAAQQAQQAAAPVAAPKLKLKLASGPAQPPAAAALAAGTAPLGVQPQQQAAGGSQFRRSVTLFEAALGAPSAYCVAGGGDQGQRLSASQLGCFVLRCRQSVACR